MKIKEYKQLSHIHLKDGRILISEATPAEIFDGIQSNSHIVIEGEVHSKFSIVSVVPMDMDDKESFIISQSPEIRQKLHKKIKFRKEELGEDTSIEYLQNYVRELLQH